MKRKMFAREKVYAWSGSRTVAALVEDYGHGYGYGHGVGWGC
jgi:hypothetical protein